MPQERRIDPAGVVVEKVEELREGLSGRKRDKEEILWLNHFDLLPGDETVSVTYESTNSGVGGGLTAAVVHSMTTGEVDTSGGNKVVHLGVAVPPGYLVTGVRLGYELTNSATHISQIRLSRVQDPPKTAVVLLDDPTGRADVGPIFVDSTTTSIDPADGPVLLDLRVSFADTNDKIAIRGLGLHLARR